MNGLAVLMGIMGTGVGAIGSGGLWAAASLMEAIAFRDGTTQLPKFSTCVKVGTLVGAGAFGGTVFAWQHFNDASSATKPAAPLIQKVNPSIAPKAP